MNPINCENLITEIKKESRKFVIANQIEPIHPYGFQAYLETGNRLIFEGQYFARRRQLVTLALSLLIEEPEADKVSMLEGVIWEICNEYTWALPAHLEVTPDGQFADDSSIFIDLFAAETAQALAEILEVHQKWLSPFIQTRIRYEVERRIFSSLEQRIWHWETLENNWSAVIAGSIGMAALSLLDKNSPHQKEIIERMKNTFHYYLNGFSADGACEEGVSYWAYGFGYYLYFAEKYQQVHADQQFLSMPILSEIAAFPERVRIGRASYVPFSDASEEEELPSGLLSFCHQHFHVPVPPVVVAPSLHFDHCYRWAHLYRNLMWTAPVALDTGSDYHYFPDVQWLVTKNKGDLVFAAKGGRNDESHNHNDIGHFVLGVKDELLLTDLGAGEYTRDYFQEDTRYHILNNRSFGHSVLIINQCEQVAGEKGAKEVAITESRAGFTFSLELAEVYPEAAGVASFRRTWEVNPEKQQVLLRDWVKFHNQDNQIVQFNLISRVKPTVEDQAVYWKGEKGILRMNFPSMANGPIVLQEGVKNHRGEEEVVYRTVLKTTCQSQYKKEYEFSIVESKGDCQYET